MVPVSAANLRLPKVILILVFAIAPSPRNTLLENAPVLFEALLNKNKPVGCVLLV